MTTEVQLKDTVRENPEKEVEAPAAAKLNQDFPLDQQVKDNKSGLLTQSINAPTNETSRSDVAPSVASHLDAANIQSEGFDRSSNQQQSVTNLFVPDVPAGEMTDLITRHCVLTEEEVDAIVLWLISSYQINCFRIFPKLALISPEKRCGKTTTLEVIHSLAKEGRLVSNISLAALFRITQQIQPTLFIDEADMLLKNADPTLVGLINSSHTKAGANVIRCVGEDFQTQIFNAWMPMVLASIGELQPTIMDRSIVINLRRKKAHEHAEPVPVNLLDLKESVRKKIQHWSTFNASAFRAPPVIPPNVGNDRAADNWTPLFKVAKVIGGAWPDRCEKAYRALTTTLEMELPTQLLNDIRVIFQNHDDVRITSSKLIEELRKCATSPWQTHGGSKGLSANQMAKLLGPYGIKPKTIRFGSQTLRGYEKDQFADAFERYLP
jgi:hypothetical protein